nr:uncharacterized protein LOC113812284 [Penaeus vannamei]
MTSLARLVTRALLVLGLVGLSHATILSSAQDGDEAAVLQYLQNGNDPDVMSDKNRTMLMFAAIEGHANIITILLQYNASLDLVDANGRTAVMFAARSGHSQVVDLLISGGASLDIQDKDLRTALILAAMANQTDTVRALLQGGADADITDFKDLKAINHAARRDRVDIVCLLKDYTTLSPSYAFGGVAGKCFLNGTVYFVGNETFNGVELVRCVDTCVWETSK